MLSLTMVTLTVCVTFQFSGVNVTLGGDTVPSVRSLDVCVTVTFAGGCVSSTSVNVAVSPNSETSRPLVGSTVKPAVSLSRFVTETSAGSRPLYAGAVLVAGDVTTWYT